MRGTPAFIEFSMAVVGLCLFLLGLKLFTDIFVYDLSEFEILVGILGGV